MAGVTRPSTSSSMRRFPTPSQMMAMAMRSPTIPESAHELFSDTVKTFTPSHPPLDYLPCAKVSCSQAGIKVCSSCKLVVYCSPECQSAHWKAHKRDCKNPLRSDGWKPIWKLEDRQPTFQDGEQLRGSALWPGINPVDVLNLQQSSSKDLSLAFVEAGDLKNIMKTINSLPDDYSGTLEIVVNDSNPLAAVRLLYLLLIIGSDTVDSVAINMALHYWFSAFSRHEYLLPMAMMNMEFTMKMGKTPSAPQPLGNKGSGLMLWGPRNVTYMQKLEESLITPTGVRSMKFPEARVAHAQSRLPTSGDDWHRVLAPLTPSHRVAFQKYRETGIVLPFGASQAHFDSPNSSFFSYDACFLPPLADPLQGWDIHEVLQSGASHSARPEDIYGCLYFYLMDQLRELRLRIREKYAIQFMVICLDPSELASFISQEKPDLRFDRVDVADHFDHSRAGLNETLRTWRPLLAEESDAAIVGYCKDWVKVQADGQAKGVSDECVQASLENLVKNIKGPGEDTILALKRNERLFFSTCHNVDAGYDNSTAFNEYLKSQGLDAIIGDTGLKLRTARRVVPHRLGVPLDASPSDMPIFQGEESWYRATMVNCHSWTERFLEFGWG